MQRILCSVVRAYGIPQEVDERNVRKIYIERTPGLYTKDFSNSLGELVGNIGVTNGEP